MIKAKKLLSILCSAAMVVSVFASTIANAASGATDEVAFGVNYKLVSETDLVKVFEIYATGFNTVLGWNSAVDFNGEVEKIASVKGSKNDVFGGEFYEGWFQNGAAMTYTGVWSSANEVATNGNILLNTVTVTLTEPLTKPLVLSAYEEAEVNDPAVEAELGYIPWYSDGDWQANTLTFDVLSTEPAKETVAATPVGSVFEGVNEASDPTTDRAVAAMVNTTLTKAITEITWKINVTAQDGKTYSGPTELKIPVANLEANSPIKVGLVVSYADADIAGVEITGIEY